MFVFLSKFLPQLIYPVGLVSIFLILSLIIKQKSRLGKILICFSLITLWIAGNRWVSLSLARSLEWQYIPEQSIPAAEAIVVLGGATEPLDPPRSGVEVNDAADRLIMASRLFHQKKAPIIFLSGGSLSWESRQTPPAEEMAEILNLLGVPDSAMAFDIESRNTYENALYSKRQLEKKDIHQIILVTSAMHMPRSVALFKHQGFEVIPAPTDFTVTEQLWENAASGKVERDILSILPSASYLSLTTSVLKEYVGILVYRLQGWL